MLRNFMKGAALAMTIVGGTIAIPLVSANATTITDSFFFKNGSDVVANGSFSYDSSKTGVIGYADLSSFSISLPNPPTQTYNLAFINSLNPTNDFVYFGYDITNNQFVPGYASTLNWGTTLAGVARAGSNASPPGFFFDALPSQADVGNNDGKFIGYDPSTGTNPYLQYTSIEISQLSAVATTPLPASLSLFLAGLGAMALIGWFAQRRKTVQLMTAA